MVLRSVGNLYALGGAGAALSLLYNLLLARIFGTGREIEAFFAAMVLDDVMKKISQTGYLMDIYLPHYFQIRRDAGREAAYRFISVLVNQFFLASLVISALFVALAPVLFGLMVGGFDDWSRGEAVRIFMWLAPLMPIQVAMIVFRHLMNAEKQFGRVEVISVAGSLLSVCTLLAFHSSLGYRVLILNVFVVEAIHLINARYFLVKLGYRHSLGLRSPHVSTREVLAKLASTSGYLISSQLLGFTVNNLLSGLPQGTFAVYRYCERVFARLRSLILGPVSTVLKVVINERVSADGKSSLETVHKAAAFAAFACLGFLFAFLTCRHDTMNFLFLGERFPEEKVIQAGLLLSVLLGTTLFAAWEMIYQNTAIALGRGKTHYVMKTLQNGVFLVLALWMIKRWEFHGVLAYRFGMALAAFALSVVLVRMAGRAFLAPLASAGMAKIVAAVSAGYFLLLPLQGFLRPFGDAGKPAFAGNAALQVALYLAITYLLTRLLRIQEVSLIEERIRKLARRK